MADFLFELGLEEVPARMLADAPGAAAPLLAGFRPWSRAIWRVSSLSCLGSSWSPLLAVASQPCLSTATACPRRGGWRRGEGGRS